MKARVYKGLCVLAVSVLLPFTTFAAASDWADSDHVRARLIAADKGFGGRDMALELDLEEGWHTYWRSPGEAGLPPRFNWDGSTNIEDITVLYPVPTRKDEGGFQTFGYSDDPVFPLNVTLEEAGQKTGLKLGLNVMVCKDICIPQLLNLEWSVPEQAGTDHRAIIDQAYASVPHKGDVDALKLESSVVGGNGLILNVYSGAGFDRFDVFVEGADSMIVSIPQIDVQAKDKKRAMIKLSPPADVEDFMASLKGQSLTVTLTNGAHAIQVPLNF